jgi:hypothetical protein
MISKHRISQLTGVTYLLSVILPILSPKISFLIADPPIISETLYFKLALGPNFFAILLGGAFTPTITNESTVNFWGYILFGLAEIIITPTFFVTGFIVGFFVTVLPVVLGTILLFDLTKKNRWQGIAKRSWVFLIITSFVYTALLTLNANTFYPHVGGLLLIISIVSTYFILRR